MLLKAEYLQPRLFYWLLGMVLSEIASCSKISGKVFPSVECYSCMSRSYEDYWRYLHKTYHIQKNFSDDCNEPFNGKRLQTVPCKSICVVLKEDNVIGGMVVGKQFIRGCQDRILVNGFNNSAIDTHRFRALDICRRLDRAQLFRYTKEIVPGGVELCSCFANECNGGFIVTLSGQTTNVLAMGVLLSEVLLLSLVYR